MQIKILETQETPTGTLREGTIVNLSEEEGKRLVAAGAAVVPTPTSIAGGWLKRVAMRRSSFAD